MASASSVTVDVFADVVCPWCYVGEARLEKALSRRPELHVVRRWHPFQLRPEMPRPGLPWRAFAEEKFGGWDRAQRAFAQVAEVGAQEGLVFDFSKVASAPNTADAHRLILWGEAQGRGRETAHALFRAYFSEGRDLGDRTQLAEVTEEVGLVGEDARALLESERYADEVRRSQEVAQQLGLSGVPFYIFNRRIGVSGAQSVEVFERALEEAAQAEAAV